MNQPAETVSAIRIPAFLIDFAIIMATLIAINKVAIAWSLTEGSMPIGILMLVCLPLSFFAYWLSGLNAGKKLFGIEVVDEKSGEKPSVRQYFIRSLLFSLVISLNLLLLLPVFISGKNKAFHDMLAGTLVVRSGGRDIE